MKRIGNGAAAIIGVGFICLQGLSYMGYITVDYNRVRTVFIPRAVFASRRASQCILSSRFDMISRCVPSF
jgi:uncharacterized membrane protein (Fun14 family)